MWHREKFATEIANPNLAGDLKELLMKTSGNIMIPLLLLSLLILCACGSSESVPQTFVKPTPVL
jgi:hypothetical protein